MGSGPADRGKGGSAGSAIREAAVIEDNKQQRKLMRPLTMLDMNRYRDELAQIVQKLGDVEAAKAATTAKYGGELKELKKNLNEVSRKIRERREEKLIDCFWKYYWTLGKKDLVEEDTGDVLESANITDQEFETHQKEKEEKRQKELPLEEAKAKEPTQWFRNDYKCPRCSKEWTDEWDAMSDDDCPFCGQENVQPHTSTATELPAEQGTDTKVVGDGTGEPLPEASNLEKTATGNGEPDTSGSGQEHSAGSETVIPVEIQNDGSVKAIGAEELQVLEFSEPKSDAGPGEQLQTIAEAIAEGTMVPEACIGVAAPSEPTATEARAAGNIV